MNTRFVPPPEDLVLARFVVLRALGAVYLVAFATAALQWPGLLGSHGLMPIGPYLAGEAEGLSTWQAFLEQPTLFWLDASDATIAASAWTGVALSAAVTLGLANAPLLLVLWALYMSFVHVGQSWYSFGWEIQLLETGLLAAFLCPTIDPRPFPRRAPTPAAFVALAWLLWRLMLGAGLIKLRGDACWRELTCLDDHYETQPVPHPLSWLWHQAPAWTHTAGVLFNHAVELVVPFLLFGPRHVRMVAAGVLAAFQVSLILSGNLAFLNWLTLIPCLACIDDRMWRRILPRALVARAHVTREPPSRAAWATAAVLLVMVAALSFAPVTNLLSPKHHMNTSFNRLHLVNTYGAFGSIEHVRREIVIEGTRANDPTDPSATWEAYEFRCKPGALDRAPCLITPYHYRLDWLMWFAAMGSPEHYPWLIHLIYKLLIAEPAVVALLAHDPFGDAPPRFVRASLYTYRFSRFGEPGWWQREYVGPYLPPLGRDHPALRRFLSGVGWL